MNNFRGEIRNTPTMDLFLILEDQLDLYSEEEIAIIKEELFSRQDDPLVQDAMAEEQELFETQEIERLKKEKREKFSNHLMTTGFNFEGYEIQKYVGVISEEVVLGTGFISEFSAAVSDFFGGASNAFSRKLKAAKDAATEKLIASSILKGGNAIIGVDFDYITFASNMIGVIANGTSVVVRKK